MIAVVGAVVASAAVAHAFDAAVVAVADAVAAAGTVESAHPRNCVVAAAAAAVAVSLSRPFAHQRQHVAPRQFHHSEGGGGSVSYFVRVEQLR